MLDPKQIICCCNQTFSHVHQAHLLLMHIVQYNIIKSVTISSVCFQFPPPSLLPKCMFNLSNVQYVVCVVMLFIFFCSIDSPAPISTFETENLYSVNLSDDPSFDNSKLLGSLQSGDFDTALQLLSGLANHPVTVGPDQFTPLHYACKHDRLDILKKLISQYGYDVQQHTLTLLQVAIENGCTDIIAYILGRNTKPFLKVGVTNPLHLAVDVGNLDVVKMLVESNILRSSAEDQEGNTPLHHAALHGHLSVAVYLANVANHHVSPKNKRGETPLHLAAKQGHFAMLKFLVDEKGCDPTSSYGVANTTPLHLACKFGSIDIVKYLSSEKSCNLECKTYFSSKKRRSKSIITGRTPLHYASYSGHLQTVSYLVKEQSCNPLCADDHGFTPIHLACQEGHFEIVQFLVEVVHCGLDELTTEDGKSPLHLAALGGNLMTVQLLSDLDDSNQSKVDNEGRTALHYAARNGCTDIVQYLVNEKYYNPNQADQIGITPLHLAAQYGKTDTVKYLVNEAHSNPNLFDESGYTPLHLAANKGHLATVQFLIAEKHCSVMVRDKAGRTPLHHACQSDYLDVVKLLCAHPDCDPNCQDKSLKATPLHLASSFGHLKIIRYLIEECSCSPLCTDKFNSTLVHRASANGQLEVMQYLVKDKQCNILTKNKFGNTPLHLACQKGQVEMIEFLLTLSRENILWRNQVGRMPLDLAESSDILSLFLKHGIDPSKCSIVVRYPYLKHWSFVQPMVRIFLLGNPFSGKSTLVKTLQASGFLTEWMVNRFHPRLASTNGKSIGVQPTMIDSRHLGKVVLYDFAGHPSFYAGHSAVLNLATWQSPSLFLVFVDLRKSASEIEQDLAYWSAFVNSSLTDSMVKLQLIIVGTHEDELTKEDYRHKPALLEKITSLTIGDVNFCRWVTVNCHKATSLNKLRLLLSQKCDGIRSQHVANYETSLARSFIQHKFQGSIVIEFRELLEFISHTDIPDIKSPGRLIRAVEDLHSRGYILLLRDEQSVENSWIIHNQEAIFSTVHSFQKQTSLLNLLGLMPISQLEKSLGLMGFNLTLIVRYFLRMQFCIKISNRKIFHSIVGFHPPHPLEDYLFFPHLIQQKVPLDLWRTGPNWIHKFGWCMQCIVSQQFLGPRYKQVLFLRLLTAFPFNTDPNSPFVARKVSCHIWEQGIAWTDSRGIEVIVEFVERTEAIICLTQLQEGSAHILDYVHYRSLLVNLIRSVRKEVCPRVSCAEYLLHPDVLASCNPINSHSSGVSAMPLPAVSLFDIATAVIYPDHEHVVANCMLFSSSAIQSANMISLSLRDLLFFESYLSLSTSLLKQLFSEEQSEVTLSDEFLIIFAEHLADKKYPIDYFVRILQVQTTTQQCTKDHTTIDEYVTILTKWRDKSHQGTLTCLRQAFDNYSIFMGTNPLVSLQILGVCVFGGGGGGGS